MPILVPVFFVVICAINLRLSESLGTFTTNSLTMSGVASKHTFGQSVMSIAFDLFEGGYTNADTLGTGYVGDYDFFLSRYQSGSSTASWTTLFGTSGFDQMTSMAVNSQDVNSYVVGMCSGTVNGVATKGSGDACIFKLDGSGNVVCSNQFGGTGKDIFTSVAYDTAKGVVYVVGNTTSPSFESTSTSGAVSGIWMSIKISDCTVINQYVQSYTTSSSPSTQIVSFDSVTAISTGGSVVGLSYRSGDDSATLVIAGTTYSSSSDDTVAFGIVKTDSSGVPTLASFSAFEADSTIVHAQCTSVAMGAWYFTYDGYVFLTGFYEQADRSAWFLQMYDISTGTMISADSYSPESLVYTQTNSVVNYPSEGLVYIGGYISKGKLNGYDFGSNPGIFVSVYIYSGAGGLVYDGQQVFANTTARINGLSFRTSKSVQVIGSTTSSLNGVSPTGNTDLFRYRTNYQTSNPSIPPTFMPTFTQTSVPSAAPSISPSKVPTTPPTEVPTATPTTAVPSVVPTEVPTAFPTEAPTTQPTFHITSVPSEFPTSKPSVQAVTQSLGSTMKSGTVAAVVVPVLIGTGLLFVAVYVFFVYQASVGKMEVVEQNPAATPPKDEESATMGGYELVEQGASM